MSYCRFKIKLDIIFSMVRFSKIKIGFKKYKNFNLIKKRFIS